MPVQSRVAETLSGPQQFSCMTPKRKGYRAKLEATISQAIDLLQQARRNGEIQDGDRTHPLFQRLEQLCERKVKARGRAIRRLKSLDKLAEHWKSYRQMSCSGKLHGEEFEKYRELSLHFLDHPHPEVTRLEKLYGDRLKAILQRVEAAVKPPVKVCYSAYKMDDTCCPVDNLDEVAVSGRAVFNYDLQDVRPYRSPIVENPTWMQVAQFANEMILSCELEEHIFLDGIEVEREANFIKEVHFGMGS